MRCPNCGVDVGNDFGRYCENCGEPLQVQHSEPRPRRSIAKTLALIAVGIIAFVLLVGGLIVVNSDPEVFYDHPTQSQIDSTRTTGTILSVLGVALIVVVFVGFLYNPRT